MVDAVQKGNRIMQVGSQRVSSIVYEKARELYASGALGEVFLIEGSSNRNSPGGAWVYPIPPDASEQTIDWNAFLVGAPQRPFDAARFFRWRCFADYGEGLAGDLFVHLLSGIHFVAGIDEVPLRAQTTGGLFRWKDGRDFPDVIETVYDYPKFRVSLYCNLNNANQGGEPIKFQGTKGTMETSESDADIHATRYCSQARDIFDQGLAGAASQCISREVGGGKSATYAARL